MSLSIAAKLGHQVYYHNDPSYLSERSEYCFDPYHADSERIIGPSYGSLLFYGQFFETYQRVIKITCRNFRTQKMS